MVDVGVVNPCTSAHQDCRCTGEEGLLVWLMLVLLTPVLLPIKTVGVQVRRGCWCG